ncbi:hypothetical protein GF325_12335 [Candidatus Bathyarchaeota archaeon]|nr:hypothetical protein [Candidatus Bathyarchaeota archaeon]
MKLQILYQDEFAERVAGHLINDIHFCEACGTGCNNCRIPFGCHAGAIRGFREITGNLPLMIDDPSNFFPRKLNEADVLLPVGLHPDLLSGIPDLARHSNIASVIVPVEDKNWVPGGLERQVADELEDHGIQHAFPRPFCTLDVPRDDDARNIIRQFMDGFKVGKAEIDLEIRNGKIKSGHVIRSQPCGAAYYIIQQIREEKIFDEVISLDEKISMAHHSFPCSASMETDPMLGDSPLHVAGYLAREAVHDAIEGKIGKVDRGLFHRATGVTG